jgi:hypothetical protein
MFVGHYCVSYGAKAWKGAVPLWLLFLAVQFLDVLWGVFVLLGFEKVRIVPGITATNPLDLYYMPYTHSLVAALVWSLLAGLAYHFWNRGIGGGVVIGAAVFSHWLLDLVVHRPDLPLVGNQFKVGLGLWNVPALALLLEVSLLLAGLAAYLRSTQHAKSGGTVGFLVFSVVLVGVQLLVFFGSPPGSANAAALTALVAYVVFAGAAGWLETRRRPRPIVGQARSQSV